MGTEERWCDFGVGTVLADIANVVFHSQNVCFHFVVGVVVQGFPCVVAGFCTEWQYIEDRMQTKFGQLVACKNPHNGVVAAVLLEDQSLYHTHGYLVVLTLEETSCSECLEAVTKEVAEQSGFGKEVNVRS